MFRLAAPGHTDGTETALSLNDHVGQGVQGRRFVSCDLGKVELTCAELRRAAGCDRGLLQTQRNLSYNDPTGQR